MAKDRDDLEEAKRIMGALVRMPPKPHDEMKLGKLKSKKRESDNRAAKKSRGK